MTTHLQAGFGIEIECYLPEGTTAAQAAAALAQRGIPCNAETYNHMARANWKVVTDGSLGDYSRGVEFVSPILRGENGLKQVETVCKALTDFGCTVNKKCGLHVHVGVANAALGFFKNLTKLYALYEPIIDAMMPASRRASANMFCRSMTAANMARIESANDLDSLINTISGRGGESRYFKLNLTAYRRHRTVEFRQHSGTLDAIKATKWAILCLKMVAAAQRADFSISTAAPTQNRARAGSKSHQIGEMMMRREGVTAREVMAATGWPSVSLPQQAGICGLQFTTQRTGREVRYFAVAAQASRNEISITGFAAMIEANDDERNYIAQRTTDLSGAVAWAA